MRRRIYKATHLVLYELYVSRCIKLCHFLPHKPGVIAYAAEGIGWIVIVMDNGLAYFILSYFRVNDEFFLTYYILPFGRTCVKVVTSDIHS